MMTRRCSCSFSCSCLTDSSRFPTLLDEHEKFKCSWQQKRRTSTNQVTAKDEDGFNQTSPCPRSASCTPEQPRWSPPDGTHNPLGRSLPLVFLPPPPPPSPCWLQREEEHQDPRSSSLQTQVGSPEGTAPPSPTPATHIQTGVKQKHTPHPSAGFLQPANQRKVRVWVIWRRSSGESSLPPPPKIVSCCQYEQNDYNKTFLSSYWLTHPWSDFLLRLLFEKNN